MCGVSRLLGCYYLYPQVIPLPSTKSVTLPPYTNFLVIGSHGLWKYVTQKEVYKCIRSYRNPGICSKRLADLAIAGGCPLDVSVIVVKIVLGEDLVGVQNVLKGGVDIDSSINMIQEEEEEEEEEGHTVTNIDDLMEESFSDNIHSSPDKSYLESEGLKVLSPDQLDALVNKDVSIEDLVDEVMSVEDDGELIREGSSYTETEPRDDIDDEDMMMAAEDLGNRRPSVMSAGKTDYNVQMSLENNLTTTTTQRDAIEDESSEETESSDESVNSIEYHQTTTNFKPAKSVPEIKAEYEIQMKDNNEMNPTLKNINTAISNIDDDDITPEEEEAIMRRGGNVKRKKSFVQSSYNRLSRHAFDTGTSFHSL